jgi:hypothetical protein
MASIFSNNRQKIITGNGEPLVNHSYQLAQKGPAALVVAHALYVIIIFVRLNLGHNRLVFMHPPQQKKLLTPTHKEKFKTI